MNKILLNLKNNIINISTLIILLVLTVFLSNTINNYSTYKLIETSFNIPGDYNTFMTNYYQTQANWLMFWLTLLACLTAIIGIAVPFILNQSYREKIKEMENEFEKQIKDLDNYKKQSIENLKTLKKDVQQIKKQAEQSKLSLPKMFAKEIYKFKENMQNAIDEVKQENILFEIRKLNELCFNYKLNNKRDEEFNNLNKLIHIAEKYKEIYSKANSFTQSLNFYLGEGYYDRALVYQYNKKEYLNAISDYIKSKELKQMHCNEDNETIDSCLLYCYAQMGKYNECNELLNSINHFSFHSVNNTLKVLDKDCSNEAKELVVKIKRMIVDPC